MTRTFGSDNAIAWVQVYLRGGPRNLLATTATYAAVIGLAMLGTVQLIPGKPGQVLSGWTAGVLALQAGILLLFAPSRVANAIRSDVASGIIESHRLMPIASPQAVIGYILGATCQSLSFAAANVFLGGIAAISGGVAPQHWLGINALMLAFAGFLWTILAFAAFHRWNLSALLFIVPAVIFFGQGGMLGLAPGFAMLATPLLGGSIFDVSATLGGIAQGYAVSLAAQALLAGLCFVAAARKFRQPDAVGFTPPLALLLLVAWVGVSWVGILWWEQIRPTFVRGYNADPSAQVVTSLAIAMVLALVPVWAAAEGQVAWLRRWWHDASRAGRRPIPDAFVIVAATLLVLPLALPPDTLTAGERPTSWMPVVLAGVAVACHLVTACYLRRTVRYYTSRLNGLLLVFLLLLWVGPLLADVVRREMDERHQAPTLTEISCVSPLGTVIALGTKREEQVYVGLIVQVGIALLAVMVHERFRPRKRVNPALPGVESPA